MATYTNNLNLTKPDEQEQYNIETFNDNFDKIDAVVDLVPKLYTNTGNNTDGSMTQAATSDLLGNKVSKNGDTMTGGLKIFDDLTSSAGQIVIKNSSNTYGIIQRADSSSYYILLTNQNNADGSWNSLRPLTINLSYGSVSFNSGITMPTKSANDNTTNGATTAFVKGATDGQWVTKKLEIINESETTGTYTKSLSSYLPQDGNMYEVYVHSYMRDHSSDRKYCRVYSTSTNNDTGVTYSQVVVGDYADISSNDFTIYVKSNGSIKWTLGGGNVDLLTIRLFAYRRCGNNT